MVVDAPTPGGASDYRASIKQSLNFTTMARMLGVIRYNGKLGATVGYKGKRGRRFIRERVTDISNPRSEAQNIQRMILATTAVSMAHFAEVGRSSIEGKEFGAPSLAYLRSEWMRMLRTSPTLVGNGYSYAYKGDTQFVPNPYLLSKGTLSPVVIHVAPLTHDGEITIDVPSGFNPETAVFSDLFPSVQLGHQLTFFFVVLGVRPLRAETSYLRFAALDNVNRLLVKTEDIEEGTSEYRLNPAVLDLVKCAGEWDKLRFIYIEGSSYLIVNPRFEGIPYDVHLGAAVIVSDKVSGKRSTAYLTLAPDVHNVMPENAAEAAASYGNEVAPVNAVADEYCQNSSDVAPAVAPSSLNLVSFKASSTGEVVPFNALVAEEQYILTFSESLAGKTISLSSSAVGAFSGNVPAADTKRYYLNVDADAASGASCTLTIGEAVFGPFAVA